MTFDTRRVRSAVPVLLLAFSACHGTAPSGSATGDGASTSLPTHIYHQVATIPIGGDEGSWDYLLDDPQGHRLYVTHGSEVVAIDTDTDSIVGRIDSLPGVHGFAVARDLGRGFASVGRENAVAMVDLSTLHVVSRVGTGEDPDAILYVPESREVWAFNGHGNSATVIDAGSGRAVATVPLPGKPEFAVYDPGQGRIYANIQDQNEIVVIDASGRAVRKTFPIAPGESATGLAVAPRHHRLFTVCENGYMVMVDEVSGLMIAKVPIGRGPDAARYDPVTRVAFSANGEDGTVTIAHLDDAMHLTVLQTLKTVPSARTMALDPLTHRIYLSAADFEPGSDGRGDARPRMVPGSFRVLVYAIEGS